MARRMPSFQDSAVIFFIALLLFGPKKLPELARQLGKLMGEFRRASNEFRMQMEDELRASEQAERQKQIAAIEAAAPATPVLTEGTTNTIATPSGETTSSVIYEQIEDPLDSHPHMQPPDRHTGSPATATADAQVAPLPIATSGDLNLLPPATGLPVARSAGSPQSSAMSPVFDSIPQAPEHSMPSPKTSDEAVTHG